MATDEPQLQGSSTSAEERGDATRSSSSSCHRSHEQGDPSPASAHEPDAKIASGVPGATAGLVSSEPHDEPIPSEPRPARGGGGKTTAEGPPHRVLRDSHDGSVLLHVAGAVVTVTLNRPQTRNAINRAAWQQLLEHARWISSRSDIRVVVLTGQGNAAFSAGADIAEFPAARLTADAARQYGELVELALEAWAALPQTVIAAVRGFCLGAGFELALTADVRIASDDAAFGIPAVKRGFGISVADARRVADVVGVAAARRLLVTGRTLSASGAMAIGLVDDVVPFADLATRVDALAAELAANAPLAVAWAKEAVARVARGRSDGDLTPEERVGAHLFATRDAAEGVAAFLARRPPRFTGR